MTKNEVKAQVEASLEKSPALRFIKKMVDTVYETVPFLFRASMYSSILQNRAIHQGMIFAERMGIKVEPLAVFVNQLTLDVHRSALEVWNKTKRMDAVRDVYYEYAHKLSFRHI